MERKEQESWGRRSRWWKEKDREGSNSCFDILSSLERGGGDTLLSGGGSRLGWMNGL